MTSLLIDFDNIIKPNKLALLETKIRPIPETKYSLGVVIVISQEQYDALHSIPKGDSRVQYINSTPFVDSINGHAYLIYDKRKRICEIMGMEGPVLPQVMESVLGSIPNDVTLWIGIVLDDPHLDLLVNEYVTAGFHDPYICKASPLGFTFKDYGLCMMRQNDIIDSNSINDVKYVLTQFLVEKKGNCTLLARLSDQAVKYLRSVSKMGSTINTDGVITQKEMAGRLTAGTIGKDLTYHLNVDRESIVSGDEEGVDIIGGLYNFHSHPQEAYDRHNVKLGWPSAQDYVGFLGSSIIHDTILHIVASLEGFYVLSLGNYWVNKKKKLDGNVPTFILEKYDMCYKKGQTPTWYVRTVNGIAYEGFPLFLVQFFPWHDATDSFIVPYRKSGVNCFARQSTADKYKKLHD
jgi:hypothetical protein